MLSKKPTERFTNNSPKAVPFCMQVDEKENECSSSDESDSEQKNNDSMQTNVLNKSGSLSLEYSSKNSL